MKVSWNIKLTLKPTLQSLQITFKKFLLVQNAVTNIYSFLEPVTAVLNKQVS